MKILIVTRNLPPLIGGMERLNWHIADELSKTHDITLLSHSEAKKTAPTHCKFYGVNLNPLPLFLILAFFKTFFICLTQKPDVLLAGSGLTAPIVVFWAKIFRKKNMVYIHGLDIKNNNTIYQLIWVPFIQIADHIIVNSTPTKELCLKKHISIKKISIIHPGVTFPPLEKNEKHCMELKEKFNLHNKKILISVGRLTERKGLFEFIQFSLPQIIREIPDTILLIVGDSANNALNKNLQTRNQIIEKAKAYNLNQYLCFTEKVTDQELSCLFYLSDAHIFPVKDIPNDPEGFGMVAIEAATHGTPTVGFSTGGVVDAISHNESGYLIEKNNYQQLSTTIIQLLQNKKSINKIICKKHSEQFSWENMGIKFYNLLDR